MSEAKKPMSAQMDAVMRIMTGKEERSIAEKFSDANRPTWEEYKKDNHDKLNLDMADQEEMAEYRRHLDKQRDKLMTGKKKRSKKKRKRDQSDHDSDDDSSSSSDGDRKRRKKHRKKSSKRKKHHRRHRDSSDEDSRKRRKRKSKKEKKRAHSDSSGDESDGSHYKLSKFFSEGKRNDS